MTFPFFLLPMVGDSPSSPSEVTSRSITCVFTEEPNNKTHEEISTVVSSPNFNPAAQNHCLWLGPAENNSKLNEKKRKKMKKRVLSYVAEVPSSSSSCSSSQRSSQKRVAYKRRNPKVLISTARRSGDALDAMALSLGMSFAAFIAQVLEGQDAANVRMSVDHLAVICTSAVRESLVNVFGDKLDCFLRNFENSFESTLRTLRSIGDSSKYTGRNHFSRLNGQISSSNVTITEGRVGTNNSDGEDCGTEAVLRTCALHDPLNTIEDINESILMDSVNHELALHGRTNQNQVTSLTPRIYGLETNQTALSTFEKSLTEQARSNDLKTLELGLTMRKLKLKETQLALNFDSNHLERSKLAMGISKASFKVEKFKNQVEDTRHAELLKKCIDCLVASLFIMSASLSYGAYVFSYRRISDATASCTPTPQDSKSWWMISNPMASFNSGLHILTCQVQVVSRMLFGLLMILAIAYLLLQRSATSKQTMPITFILLLLGVACGLAGKFCVDTLGGSGLHWLLYWESLCLIHFFSNIFTSLLFFILHGHVSVSQSTNSQMTFPYWIRRFLFYVVLLVILPLLCGLIPFASVGEWRDHFSQLVSDYLLTTGD